MREPASTPRISVVVLSLRSEPHVRAAVQSLLDQDTCCELIVVNTGGGDIAARLAGLEHRVQLINIEEPHFVGRARNLGIASATGRYVAFLAADCLAAPGWLSARLEAHGDGHALVAAAVMPFRKYHPVSWAVHALQYRLRSPHTSPAKAQLYSISFDRTIFDAYGPFREDLRVGEDTEFLMRLPRDVKPRWAPQVVVLHRHETHLWRMLKDQYHRGARQAVEMHRIKKVPPRRLLISTLGQAAKTPKLVWRGLRGIDRMLALLSFPICLCAYGARVAGIWSMRNHGAPPS